MISPDSFISGLRNCHLEGLNSYVIRNRVNRTEGMVRVFYNRACSQMAALYGADDRVYTLAPHNHRRDIILYPIWGDVTNLLYRVDRRTHDRRHVEFCFKSAIIDGKMSAGYKDCVDLYLKDARILDNSGVRLRWNEVHTVLSVPGSAWLVVEGEEAPARSESLFYSPTGNGIPVFDQTGMYQEMEGMELRFGNLFDAAMQVWEKRR